VYVPETRAPPVKGYGVVVWISPNPLGVIPDREIVPELEARGLIWIGANESGNQRPTLDRLRLALDGADAVSRFYPVDGQRVWVAGYSGGGRIASALVFHFPDVFSGALLYMGCNFYEPLASRQKPGLFWPPAFAPPTSSRQKKIERQSRVVLATAEFDFNRFQTRATRDAMKQRGFEHVLYLEVPAVGHFFGFQASPAREALAYLDGAADEP
jgi:pimeloyl-ACP methyl ester carboxylesterase